MFYEICYSKTFPKIHTKTPTLKSSCEIFSNTYVENLRVAASILVLWKMSMPEWSSFAKSDRDSIMSRKTTEKTGKLTLFKKVCHTQSGCKNINDISYVTYNKRIKLTC